MYAAYNQFLGTPTPLDLFAPAEVLAEQSRFDAEVREIVRQKPGNAISRAVCGQGHGQATCDDRGCRMMLPALLGWPGIRVLRSIWKHNEHKVADP